MLDQDFQQTKHPGQRWRVAFTAIRFTRLIASLLSQKILENHSLAIEILHDDDHDHDHHLTIEILHDDDDDDDDDHDLAIEILHDDDHDHDHAPREVQVCMPSINIDQKTLVDMVQEKSTELLNGLGGPKEVAAILGSNEKEGLPAGDVELLEHRRQVFGANGRKEKQQPMKSFATRFFESLKEKTLIILLVCAVMSLIFGIKQHGLTDGCSDGASNIIAVLLVVFVSSMTKLDLSNQFRKVAHEMSDIKVQVLRGRRHFSVSIFDIVVGDVVCLRIGDQVPADGLLLNGYSLRVDESGLRSGDGSQSVEINSSRNPFLLSGSKVINGYGSMLVTSVGMNTTWGKIMSSRKGELFLDEQQTPIQAFLNKLTSRISKAGLAMAMVVSMILWFNHREKNIGQMVKAIVGFINIAVTIVALAIPEGLPLAATLTLACSVKQMMKNNVMIAKLTACETMASATTICKDTTGTDLTRVQGIKTAIESCQGAGMNVKMVTGDSINAAKAIAIECGILDPEQDIEATDEAVIEGVQFRNYSSEERMERVDNIRVMARSSPLDKLLMVQCLKAKGHVVAVSSGGTDDASAALKEADIGLFMGTHGGIKVMRESSDIVILDGNFASVVIVLRWARCVYNNVQKFIQFQLIVNIAAFVFNFIAAISSGEIPLTSIQLLWVNLVVNILGVLAFSTNQPTDDLMSRPPIPRKQSLISYVIWKKILVQAIFQALILLTIQFKGRPVFGWDKKLKNTLIFNIFALSQLFSVFNARVSSLKNMFRIKMLLDNKLFFMVIATAVLVQVLIVEFPNKVTNSKKLEWKQWCTCTVVAALSWVTGRIVK